MKDLLPWNRMAVAVTLTTLIFAGDLQAKDKEIGGNFVFAHDPPVPAGFCYDDGIPIGTLFPVEGEFSGQGKVIGPFTGTGQSDFCAFFPDVAEEREMAGDFTGTFTWVASDGSTLSGSFDGYDLPTDNPLLFEIFIFIDIEEGTGRFEGATGTATAVGIDDPFITHSVTATFEGTLNLPKD